MRPVAVFDTNVLFSAVAWKGKPFECVELARTGVVNGAMCRELLDELTEKLQAKLSFSAEQGLRDFGGLAYFPARCSHHGPTQGRCRRSGRR